MTIPNSRLTSEGAIEQQATAAGLARRPACDSSEPSARLTFCAFDECFCEKSWEWLNDPEIKRLTLTPDFTRESQLRWFKCLGEKPDYLIWGLSFNGAPVGAVGLKKITRTDGEYWGYIGERQCWRLGLGGEMVRFILNQARALKLREVYLRAHRDNVRAVNLYVRNGFKTLGENDGILHMRVSLCEADV